MIKIIPIKWYRVNCSFKIQTANMLVKPGPIIAAIPVLSAPILVTAAAVKKVGITVQKIAIIKINNIAVLLTTTVDIVWVKE